MVYDRNCDASDDVDDNHEEGHDDYDGDRNEDDELMMMIITCMVGTSLQAASPRNHFPP